MAPLGQYDGIRSLYHGEIVLGGLSPGTDNIIVSGKTGMK